MDANDGRSSAISLRRLAMMNKVPNEHWKKLEELMASVETLVLDLLNSRIDPQSQTTHSQPGEVRIQGGTENVLDPEKHLLDRCLEVLDSRYNEYMTTVGECDERLFLQKGVYQRFPVLPTTSMGSLVLPSSTPTLPVVDAEASVAAAVPSPVKEWLSVFDQSHPLHPSEKLNSYLESCDGDLAIGISSRVFGMVQRLFPHNSAAKDISYEASLGIKLFYHALESLLEREARTRSGRGFAHILKSHTFTLSLMACAVEIVTAALKLEHLAFPSVLNLLQLKAFDFSKIIDLFLRAIEDLPPPLMAHLLQIDERIVEELAWMPGSSIYPLILETSAETSDSAQKGELPAQGPFFKPSQQSLRGLSLDQRSPASAFKVVASSSRTGLAPPSQTWGSGAVCAGSTAESSQTGSMSRKELKWPEGLGPIEEVHSKNHRSRVVLEDFFRKQLRLCAIRLMDLKSHLDFQPANSNTIMLHVYKTLKCGLYEQTSLFYNRHLDQILLCTLFGVCKVNRLKVTFKEIVHRYKQQRPPEIYRNVILRQSNPEFQMEETSDIIDFYNSVFVTRMQSHLLTCCKGTPETTNDKGGHVKRMGIEGDEEPLSCASVSPWLISDTAHLSCLLKRDRQMTSLPSWTPPPPSQATRETKNRRPYDVTDGSGSSGVESDRQVVSNSEVFEQATKRPRF